MNKDIPEGVNQTMRSLQEFSDQIESDRKPKEKLVRDKMPELCSALGMTPMTYRVATEEEMRVLLMNKLREEVAELQELINTGKGVKTLYDLGEELADIKEVIEAIAVQCGLFKTDIEIIHNEKQSKKGGFTNRIVWDGVR